MKPFLRPGLLPAVLSAVATLALPACNRTTSPAGVAAPSAATGCQGAIGDYRAIMRNDLAMGHVNPSVHRKVMAEIDQAQMRCREGHDAQASRMIDATKTRYGYR